MKVRVRPGFDGFYALPPDKRVIFLASALSEVDLCLRLRIPRSPMVVRLVNHSPTFLFDCEWPNRLPQLGRQAL
jgi:hypothetical protein